MSFWTFIDICVSAVGTELDEIIRGNPLFAQTLFKGQSSDGADKHE